MTVAVIQGMVTLPSVPLGELLSLLAQCIEVGRNIPGQVVMSVVRRAICRLDELAFDGASHNVENGTAAAS